MVCLLSLPDIGDIGDIVVYVSGKGKQELAEGEKVDRVGDEEWGGGGVSGGECGLLMGQ